MKIPPSLDLLRLVTIPELARRIGVPRSTLFRQLLVLHAGDRQRGQEHALWLFRPHAGPWSVNLPRLRLEHPERFGVPSAEELHTQLVEVREYGRFTRRQVNALIAAFRAFRKRQARQPIAGVLREKAAEPSAVPSEVRLRQASNGGGRG